MMKYLFLLALCLLGCEVWASDIKGKVFEKVDGKKVGLPGANVIWLGTTQGVVTDVDGNFELKWNDSGCLVVSFIGYTTDTVEVFPGNRHIEIELIAGQMLDGVNVFTRGNTTIMSTRGPLIEQVITGEELCKAACCNLGESFTTNASVDVSYADAVTGAKQIQLLGLTGKYVQMMTENMPNFRDISSLYGLSYVPGPWMSAISVSKGAGSVINGYEAIAGQISVDYKKPPTSEKVFANIYASTEGMVEFNANTGILLNDKWSTAFLIHGDWMPVQHDANQDGFMDMPEKRQYNLMNRWQYKTNKWFLQFGGKFLDERRVGGQKGFKWNMRGRYGAGELYGIGIDARRYEAFMKIGYLMPQYENTSMAWIFNYTNHDQDACYGARDYKARQRTLFANYIFQSIFGTNENQKYSTGLTFNFDRYDESFNDFLVTTQQRTSAVDFLRTEKVIGVFFQYTGSFWEKLTVMAGLRYDYHNLYGGFFTPRLHLAYAPDDFTILKASAGYGARVANILADNAYLLASANAVYVNDKLLVENSLEIDNLEMEEAWNLGVQLNRKFMLWGRLLNINLDYYRTDFVNQVVVDNETQAGKVNFYDLDGDSYSNCYQIEVKYELIPRLDVTGAFRYNDVKSTIAGKLKRAALQSKYKGLLNLSYYTNMKKWQFDFTTQFNGGGRIPKNPAVPKDMQRDEFPPFQLMNAQVTKFFRHWSIYAGCENIGDFTQDHPILSPSDPWGAQFDSSKIWGPVHGRKFYLGIRFSMDRL